MTQWQTEHSLKALKGQAVYWVTRLHSGECTQAEREQFNEWLAQNHLHHREYERAEKFWSTMEKLKEEEIPLLERARLYSCQPRILLAASVAFVALIGLLSSIIFFNPHRLGIVYQTAKGEHTNAILADGTNMQLNTDTRVRVAYSENSRLIFLDHGEVLFSIKKGDARPFEIIAAEGSIKDIGTSFCVQRDHDHVKVVVLEGKVVVTTKQSGQPVSIGKNEQLQYDGMGTISPIKNVDANTTTAWTRGRLVFSGSTLAEISSEISRYNDVKIVVNDPELNQLRVSGTFKTNDIDNLLHTLESILPLISERSIDGVIHLRSISQAESPG